MELKRLKEPLKRSHEVIKYIVGALVAVFAFILGRRSSRELLDTTGERVNSLGDSLEQISDTVECSERTDRELRESMLDIEDTVSDIGNSIEATEHTIDGVRETHSEIERASEDVGKSISRIRDLIKEERERNKGA